MKSGRRLKSLRRSTRTRSAGFWYLLTTVLAQAACTPDGAVRGDADRRLAAIDSLMELNLTAAPAPGFSIAVVQGGDTIVMRGYGIADLEHGAPVTDSTVFGYGSITKSFTAAAVLGLVEDGRLDLESSAGARLPDLAGPARRVTVHQLLTHTSGLPNFTDWFGVTGGVTTFADHPTPLTRWQMLEELSERDLLFEPGTEHRYNSSGYFLLGMLVEAASGESYLEHLSRTQLEPHGLESIGMCDPGEVVPHRASGYQISRGRYVHATPYRPTQLGSYGSLCGTARDLVRWFRGVMHAEIVSRSTLGRMTQAAEVGGRHVPYGYGLRLGNRVAYHGGGFPGFNAWVIHGFDDDLTIAVLANGNLHVSEIARRIAWIVRDGPPGEQRD